MPGGFGLMARSKDRAYRMVLFVFVFVVESGGEIIDFVLTAGLALIIPHAEDLSRKLFFHRFFATLGLKPLGAVARRLGIGTEVLPCGAAAITFGGGKIRLGGAHGAAGGTRKWGSRT